MDEMHKFTWTSYGSTHTGKIRKINQDAFLDLPDKQLWMVADGMGGHKAGEFASSAIANALQSITPGKSIGITIKQIYRELYKVNRKLLDVADAGGESEVIGSTVAVLTANARLCVCIWSGDSRIYLFRRGELKQITRDHNYASDLRANGLDTDEAESYPFSQALTHALGGEPELYLESQIQEIRSGDIFLLCSDGLNKEVSDTEINNILKTATIEHAVTLLIQLSLSRGARDNVTIILAQASNRD
jgi:serine/threonine protein phosphatase PrpC